ncbi:hypothetical protein BBF93_13095 [Hyphomonas sp. CACIAM 19H1]|uniref:polysaccharide pyruvyl transferase family protein n=1 Tax=Hyphomonas sp. CACIAM 19H1 TaxID=1873716 RepID=UPI000DED7076|nr:polysaccharide pyruvyl transferase family protein [Hyphomonas sp. CACIAM 19H1]AXE65050.1 hypothetical protein BBF93_13095 [Hyphomonas sp. CACIAM 19H1]
MKIGILTYHFADSYGALMQAYALRAWLRGQGHDAQFVNYHPAYVEGGGPFDAPWDLRKWKKNATILYMRLTALQRGLFGNRPYIESFEQFRKDHLGVSGPALETLEDVAGGDLPDVLVCGSDQIWNPSAQRGLDPVYFLQIPGAERCYRFSYAASFGRATLDPAFHAEAGELLSSLDGISVREQSGIDIVGSISGRIAVCVPDPTLLLGDFSGLLAHAAPGPSGHIFSYALRAGEPVAAICRQAASRLEAEVVSPFNPARRWPKIGKTIYPSPIDWLAGIDRSALVVSNSFHGIALSIILQRPFIAASLPGAKQGLSERIRNLLILAGLEDRLVTEYDEHRIDELIQTPINWLQTDQRLRAQRKDGEQFLQLQLAAALRTRPPEQEPAS